MSIDFQHPFTVTPHVPKLLSIGTVFLVLFICVLVIAVLALVALSFHYHVWRRLLKRELVFLEVTPPSYVGRTPQATQELFIRLHTYSASRTWQDKLLRRPLSIPFEIQSSNSAGIRYVIAVERALAARLRKDISSYLPASKVAEVTDCLPADTSNMRVLHYKQTGHYRHRLASVIALEQHDPEAYLTNAMSQLVGNEQMAIQYIVTPIRKREAKRLADQAMRNADLIYGSNSRKGKLLMTGLSHISGLLLTIIEMATSFFDSTPSSRYSGNNYAQRNAYDRQQVIAGKKPARTISPIEQEKMTTMHDKLTQPLFRVSIRAMAISGGSNSAEARMRLAGITSSLAAYADDNQCLRQRPAVPFLQKYLRNQFKNRQPQFIGRREPILCAAEVADLYHFPLSKNSQTDNLVTSLSKTLPAPLSQKQDTGFSVVLGTNVHHGSETPIGLTEAEREKHVFIVGGTGNGKTTLMQYAIIQDMQNGRGVAVVDPHGDLAETLLKHVPPERTEDVIYLNPDDLDFPTGLNLLELTPGLSKNNYLRERDAITSAVVSIFRKVFSEEGAGGHRIEYILRNTVLTALTTDDPTLFTILQLLQDPDYRKYWTDRLKDKSLIDFWKNEFGQAGAMQRVKMAAGVTHKVGRFDTNAPAKFIMSQPKSTINFDDILDSKKILICNLAKGTLGEDVSELFGITILAKLQLAAMRRTKRVEAERTPFYVYVDEFQNFATPSFMQLLSESRKYKLFMMIAEQSTSQQEDQQMVQVILANAATVICFKTGNPQDEKLLLSQFAPKIEPGEIVDLPRYSFFAKFGAVHSQDPFSGTTIVLPDEGSKEVAALVKENSRKLYGTPQDEIVTDRPVIVVPKPPTTKPHSKKFKPNTKPNKRPDDEATEQGNTGFRPIPSRG